MRALLRLSALVLLICTLSVVVMVLGSGKAFAHSNTGVNWRQTNEGGSCPSSPGPLQTGFWVYANTPSTVVSLPYGTSSTSIQMVGESKVCPQAGYGDAYNAAIDVFNINGSISGLGGFSFGTVTKDPLAEPFRGWPNKTATRNITINTSGISNSPGNHQYCFQWQGRGDYGWNLVRHYTGVNTFCIDIYIQPQPTGTLSIIKYPQGGANNTHLNACQGSNCTGDGGRRDITVNAGTYTVTATPDSGYKVTNIRINRYGPGCSPCTSNNGGNSVNATVNAGNTTYVDVFFEPIQGTFSIVKYPQRGSTIANMTAYGRDSSNTTLFTVSSTESQDSKVVNVANNYKAVFTPTTGNRVTRVRVNRQSTTGVTTVCDPCSLSGDTLNNVQIVDGRTTWVDVFYEPDIRGSLDVACPKPTPGGPYNSNGKIAGWVIDYFYSQQENNRSITPSQVRIRITEKNASGNLIASTEQNYTVTADQDRPDLPINTSNPRVGRYHGFSFDVPVQFFNGKKYDVKVFPLRNNSGIANPPDIYLLGQKEMDCGDSRGAFRCEKRGDRNYIVGWGFDAMRPSQAPEVRFFFDSTPTDTNDEDARYNLNIRGSVLRPDIVTVLRNSGYPNVGDTVTYGFDEEIPPALHDGLDHTLRVYLDTQSNPNFQLNAVDPVGTELTFGPNIQCGSGGGGTDPWRWPWIQTFNGDVISSSGITGQIADSQLPGARPQDSIDKDSEYLIVSAIGGGGPFCSTNNYILGNTAATDGSNCDNGTGYQDFNIVSSISGDDRVVEAIQNAFNSNQGSNCTATSPVTVYKTATLTSLSGVYFNDGIPNGSCLNGNIYKVNGPLVDAGSITVESGRITIFVDGNLNINQNITYSYNSGGYNDLRKIPNLAIIVNGNINIDKSVTSIDAALYAKGTIKTCSQLSTDPTSGNQCASPILVKGLMAARNGYSFGRVFTDKPNPSPAEKVLLTGQTVAYPPPGLETSFIADEGLDYRIDTSEFSPKF